jgi:hypothetical protein
MFRVVTPNDSSAWLTLHNLYHINPEYGSVNMPGTRRHNLPVVYAAVLVTRVGTDGNTEEWIRVLTISSRRKLLSSNVGMRPETCYRLRYMWRPGM